MPLLKPDAKTVFLCNACLGAAPWAGGYLVGYPGFDGICDWCGSLAQQVAARDVSEPQIAQHGPFEWSPSLEVAKHDPWVWDVNLYYRDLRVPTDATRAQIKAAYQALGGQDDDRLTYIVKVLLDPEKRAAYDSIQPGDFYFDKFIREAVQQRILDDLAGWTEPTEGDLAEHQRTLKEDLDRRMNRPVSDSPLDRDSLSDETASNRSDWGYYAWRTAAPAAETMALWRCQLALAMREEGFTTALRVGIAKGLDAPWAILPIGHRPVAFLSEGERPTREAASALVRFLTTATRTTLDEREK